MRPQATLLLVDDDRHVLSSMADWLREQGYKVDTAATFAEGVAAVDRKAFDVVLVDIRLGEGEGDGFDLLAHVRQVRPDSSVILLTGYGSVEAAVEAIRQGAFDFLTKPLIDQELEMAIQRALSQREVIEENRTLRAQLDLRFGLENLVGHDHRMLRIYDMVDSVADTRATVLVTGESGTGKSLVARAIHRRSARRDRAFVSVNCAALPHALLESELFGHTRGAFTGAVRDRRGLFSAADQGTIFLDEIGEMAPELQGALLRVLQSGEYRPVGSDEAAHADVRVVAATRRSLAEEVRAGRFREDLFFRLNGVHVRVPPLRERREDIPLLIGRFLEKFKVSGEEPALTDEARACLMAHDYPGNVRELETIIRRAVLFAKEGKIGIEALPPSVTKAGAETLLVPVRVPATGAQLLAAKRESSRAAADELERAFLLQALAASGNRPGEAARRAGMNRSQFEKMLSRHGLSGRQKDE